MERLQKIIANSGYCSRRKAEEYISEGKVKVNGQIIKELGYKAPENASIEVNNKIIKNEKKEYYLLYKPENTISSAKDDCGRKTVVDLISTESRIYPVGRLDYNTTGILILTNDGELTNILMHPSYNIEKTYVAKVEGILTGEEFNQLKRGITIEGRKVIPKRVKLRLKNTNKKFSKIEITITEGRNHIIKKIFEQMQHPVLELKRESIAFLNLQGLKKGQARKLTLKEIKKLYALK